VLCEGKGGWSEFIVKVFSEAQLLDKPRVHGEFSGSWLSEKFDLLTPSVGWIKMDQNFINSLPADLEALLDFHDDRSKFGSRILASFQHFPPWFKHSRFKRVLPVDRLFAFDNFIRNSDRGSHKPKSFTYRSWSVFN
jgi:hypothetical protein